MPTIRQSVVSWLFLLLLLPGWSVSGVRGVESSTAPDKRSILVLDISGSMERERKLLLLKGSVAAMLAILPTGHEVALVLFNHKATILVPPTKLDSKTRAEVIERLAPVKAEGGTDILAGVKKALDLLPDGGRVLLLSDGAQTGDGGDPLPESVWGKSARALTERAGKQRIVIHSLGLGKDADAHLLERLALETAGEYLAISRPDDLIATFVQLVSQIGSFWRRSRASEFTVSTAEDVIAVSACGKETADSPLFRISVDSRRQPVRAEFQVRYAGICALRFHLVPGEYAFAPSAKSYSDLLRPMYLHWQMPAEKQLPANRRCRVTLRARPDHADVIVKGIQVHTRLEPSQGNGAATVQATTDAEGRAELSFPTGPQLRRRFRIDFEAEQEGWSYRLGSWSAELVKPPPLKVKLLPTVPAGELAWVTRGEETKVVFEAVAECSAPELGAKLCIASSTADLAVSPSEVRLDQPRIPLRLSLAVSGGKENAKRIAGTFSLRVSTEDLVPPLINDKPEEKLPFQWRRLFPELLLDGLPGPGEILTIRRGKARLFPVRLEGRDLKELHETQSPAVRVDSSRLPVGFQAEWAAGNIALPQLRPGEHPDAALRLRTSLDTLPGRYTLDLGIQSTHSKVPLNGNAGVLAKRIEVEVEPIELQIKSPTGGASWSVRAPIHPFQRDVHIEVESLDSGTLPPIEVHASTDTPIRISRRGSTWLSPSRLRTAFELVIPAQSAPFQGQVRFVPKGPIVCHRAGILAVEVLPVRLQVQPESIQVARYPGGWERLLGWYRSAQVVDHGITIRGAGWEDAECSWSLIATAPDGSELIIQPSPDQKAVLKVPKARPSRYSVRLASPYRHTVFEPGDSIAVPIEEVVVSLPLGALLAVGGGLLLVVVLFLRPWPIRVGLATGGIHRGLGRVALHRLCGCPGLKLWLKRGLFGLRLCRAPNDQSLAAVRIGSKGDLLPGESLRAFRGDIIEVRHAQEPFRCEVLCGRPERSKDEILDSPGVLSPEDSMDTWLT